MTKKHIAYCIMTYDGREDAISRLLYEYNDILTFPDIDVYFFDSSEGDAIQRLVEEYVETNCVNNTFYHKAPSHMDLNDKIYSLITGNLFDRLYAYKYLWISRDENYFSKSLLEELITNLKTEHYDVFLVDCFIHLDRVKKKYINQNEFFQECAKDTMILGSMIFCIDTMLSKVNWQNYDRFMDEPLKLWFLNSFCLGDKSC